MAEINQAPPAVQSLTELKDKLWRHLTMRQPEALAAVLPALGQHPHDAEILLMTVVAALLDEKPQPALRYLDRFLKKYRPIAAEDVLLRLIALAEQGVWTMAAQLLAKHDRMIVRTAVRYLPIGWQLYPWFHNWLDRIEREERKRKTAATRAQKLPPKKPDQKTPAPATNQPEAETVTPDAPTPEFAPLPRYEIKIPLTLSLPETLANDLSAGNHALSFAEAIQAQADFRLRYEYTQLGLLQGFDELLCLPLLHGVETYWYQVEAVRKVLKQFRGRVLLADEVGLGKTVEAGMALKEYLLRGMVRRVLILTPATLVGQW